MKYQTTRHETDLLHRVIPPVGSGLRARSSQDNMYVPPLEFTNVKQKERKEWLKDMHD